MLVSTFFAATPKRLRGDDAVPISKRPDNSPADAHKVDEDEADQIVRKDMRYVRYGVNLTPRCAKCVIKGIMKARCYCATSVMVRLNTTP